MALTVRQIIPGFPVTPNMFMLQRGNGTGLYMVIGCPGANTFFFALHTLVGFLYDSPLTPVMGIRVKGNGKVKILCATDRAGSIARTLCDTVRCLIHLRFPAVVFRGAALGTDVLAIMFFAADDPVVELRSLCIAAIILSDTDVRLSVAAVLPVSPVVVGHGELCLIKD